MLSAYKFCNESDSVEAVNSNGSWSVLIGGKVACSMSSGAAHKFTTQTQAEVFGRQLKRGYTGGSFLSSDVENYI